MIFTTPVPFSEAIASREVKTILPTTASSAKLMRVAPELRERAMFSARVSNFQVLQSISDRLDQIVNPESIVDPVTGESRPPRPGEYMSPGRFREEIRAVLKSIGYRPAPGEEGGIKDLTSMLRLDLIRETNEKLSRSYGYWAQGQDEAVLDAFPALEMFRGESRQEPRKWLARWGEARAQTNSLTTATDPATGVFVALKNDPIWTALSAFGLPYPPFDFGSGMDVRDVNRLRAMSLGILSPEARVAPQTRPFNETLEVSEPERKDDLYRSLMATLGDKARIEDGVLTIL